MKSLFSTGLVAASVLLASGLADVLPGVETASVYAAEQKKEKKRRRTPALGSRVYTQLARAQEIADAGDVEKGLEVLRAVEEKKSSLNAYELAMLYNFYGFIYYNAERVGEAIASFEKVVAQQPIPETLELSTLFSLAQLAMANGDYDKTLKYIERWEQLNTGKIPVKNYVLKAQASYAAKYYDSALTYLKSAIKEQKAEGYRVDENWYVLLRAIYFELKQPEKVTEVLETMVRLFNKPEYWTQLAGMYGELGEEKKQLAVMEAAYQQGYVTKKSDLRNLSQIYYFNGLPFKAAQVMEKGIKDKLIEANEKNVKFLAQSWVGAKEYDQAIATYAELAKLTDNGDADQQIAELYLQKGDFTKTIEAGNKATAKGKLTNPGNLYLALGMANFNLKNYDQAIVAFNSAKGIKNAERMAAQWVKFVEREKRNAEAFAAN